MPNPRRESNPRTPIFQPAAQRYADWVTTSLPINVLRLIKICLKETYNKARISKYESDKFPVHNCQKQVDALSPLLFNFALE
jgi:hypothetical protein